MLFMSLIDLIQAEHGENLESYNTTELLFNHV